ncbi:MAG: C40 family peptidase [Lachnospiraceae bacterium]|nr:C40 family peptidase [Lachnospiraceae bacterium]
MFKRMKKIIAAALAVLMLCSALMPAVSVYADPAIDDAKKKRDETQEQLDEVNATLEELAEEQASVEDEIDEMDDALTEIMGSVEALRIQTENKEAEIYEAELRYEEAVETERSQYEAMKVRIRYMYEQGDTTYLALLMESKGFAEMLTKADYIEELYEYDRNMLISYQDTVKEVAELKAQLEEERLELLAITAEYEQEQAYMEGVISELQAVAADYKSRISKAKAKAGEYAKLIAQQNKEIKRLEEEERKRKEEEARKKAEEAERKRREAEEALGDAPESGQVSNGNNTFDISVIYNSKGSQLGKNIAAYGCKFIGNPYVPGGTSLTNGCDCSGFVFSVYKAFGYTVPRTSYQLRSAGKEVSASNAEPGDVVCYPGHVGIYIGGGMIVHASTQKTGIKVSYMNYRTPLTIRRII